MTSLGEMSTLLPVSGSFETYATRFVDPALGFTLGWNYWFCWSICVASELVAGSLIVKFWLPHTNTTLWSILFLVIIFVLNIFSARIYGESEYWFAGIKVVTIIVFIITGLLMIIGILGNDNVGFSNWVISDGSGGKAPFVGGITAIINVFLVAGFSFSGTSLSIIKLIAIPTKKARTEYHVPVFAYSFSRSSNALGSISTKET
jgi:lysine-specific permease